MDIVIQLIIVSVAVGSMLALSVPLFTMVSELLAQVIPMLSSTLPTLAPYFSFGYGMCARLVGSDMLLVSFLAVVIILPILYFGAELLSKLYNIFVP